MQYFTLPCQIWSELLRTAQNWSDSAQFWADSEHKLDVVCFIKSDQNLSSSEQILIRF